MSGTPGPHPVGGSGDTCFLPPFLSSSTPSGTATSWGEGWSPGVAGMIPQDGCETPCLQSISPRLCQRPGQHDAMNRGASFRDVFLVRQALTHRRAALFTELLFPRELPPVLQSIKLLKLGYPPAPCWGRSLLLGRGMGVPAGG